MVNQYLKFTLFRNLVVEKIKALQALKCDKNVVVLITIYLKNLNGANNY